MKSLIVVFWVSILILWTWITLYSQPEKNMWHTPTNNTISWWHIIKNINSDPNKEQKIAYVAWWCFWCIESIFDGTSGVSEAISWYIWGTGETANYKDISTGNTQHREWVKIIYDPTKLSFKEIIDIFWRQIDPTDEGGQFADRGFQYTTAIYYSNEEEKKIIETSKTALENSEKFDQKIVTQILPISDFFDAEEHHQDYAQKQTLRYKAYEVGSWRAAYKKDTWGNTKIPWVQKTPFPNFSNTDLKDRLTPLQYKVTQKNGTERAFSDGNYHDNKEPGIYIDIVDGTPLYSSTHKYDSGTWWPSFWRSIDDENIFFQEDNSFFSKRIEVRSKKANSHLGHIFQDGPKEKWWMRHCINGASLYFIHKDDFDTYWYWEYKKLFQ